MGGGEIFLFLNIYVLFLFSVWMSPIFKKTELATPSTQSSSSSTGFKEDLIVGTLRDLPVVFGYHHNDVCSSCGMFQLVHFVTFSVSTRRQ